MGSACLLSDFQPSWKVEKHRSLRHPLYNDLFEVPVLVCDSNVVDLDPSASQTAHCLFEDYCDSIGLRRAAQQVAVDYGEEEYSFLDLESLSNQIARYLLSTGVVVGDRIGLLFDRSIYAYAAILGVMKAGAAFVPLDKSFPSDRIEFILQDSDADLLLSVQSLADDLPSISQRIIVVDSEAENIDRQSANRLPLDVPCDSLAYIIYTSGSTGRPKGVAVTHASICNFLKVASATYGYIETDRVYQGLTIAFDFSFEEIWLPLLVGATLVPAPTDTSLVGDELAGYLQQHRVTALCCTPTLLATISEPLPMLRFIMVSGEACPQPLAQRWAGENRRMLNTYGPTEATVTATWQVMSKQGTVTIGGPLPSYSILILSPTDSTALAQGEVGEIAIAGIGLAEGYVNLPQKTQSVFIDDFLCLPDNPSSKIYRTGDLGRINHDCTIDYLGRIDTQVKIRGYRIELEEIESVAMSVMGISQAVTTAVDVSGGDKELVLYVSCTCDCGNDTIENLESTLRERMPGYMVPAFIEVLDDFPVLPSGKVDRKALPRPELRRRQTADKDFQATTPGMQTDLASHLAEVLSLDSVSATSHFFSSLGANSLSMAKFVSVINKSLPDSGISLKEVYQNPTIEKLAFALESRSTATKDTAYVRGPNDRLPQHTVSNLRYVLFSTFQITVGLLLGFLGILIFVFGLHWLSGVETLTQKYQYAFAYTNFMFVFTILFFWGLKWLTMGKGDDKPIPLWTAKHLKLWVAGIAISGNPLNAFVGLPLHVIYLRMIGVKVGKNTTIMAGAPTFPDLVSVGSNTMIREKVYMAARTVRNGYILPGPISIGDNVFVSPVCILDAGSTIEDNIQLGNNSVVYRNQVLRAGQNYQGSPAIPVTTNFIKSDEIGFGAWRRWIYTALLIVPGIFLAPLVFLLLDYLAPRSAILLPYLSTTNIGWMFSGTVFFYFFGIVLACVSVTVVPRIIRYFLKTDTSSPLFGVQYVVSLWMARFSNSKFLNRIFGDSSLIMYYFKAIGYGMKGVVQTGSNAGVQQQHNTPFLCGFSRNAMVADGLTMKNVDISHTTFKLGAINIPEDTFLGNDIYYPTGAKIGSNCLVGTKTMVPIDGQVRSGIGILGSPPFEIPRSVNRDQQFDQYKDPELLRHCLNLKLMSNLRTLGLFFFKSCTLAFFLTMATVLVFRLLHAYPDVSVQSAVLLASGIAGLLFAIFYTILFEHIATGFRGLQPRYCSIYEKPFWNHERYWKMNENPLIEIFNGTALKPWFQRLRGLKVGKRVYDAGCSFPEPGLVSVGDDCCLNVHSIVQAHSMEDGVFKSDRVEIGNCCNLGVGAFIHYGTVIHDGSSVLSDSFLMKGSVVPEKTVWGGNPANQLARQQPAKRVASAFKRRVNSQSAKAVSQSAAAG